MESVDYVFREMAKILLLVAIISVGLCLLLRLLEFFEIWI